MYENIATKSYNVTNPIIHYNSIIKIRLMDGEDKILIT